MHSPRMGILRLSRSILVYHYVILDRGVDSLIMISNMLMYCTVEKVSNCDSVHTKPCNTQGTPDNNSDILNCLQIWRCKRTIILLQSFLLCSTVPPNLAILPQYRCNYNNTDHCIPARFFLFPEFDPIVVPCFLVPCCEMGKQNRALIDITLHLHRCIFLLE